ncbi:nicotinate-nucleotide--dimethylbenzimidazole phosphoribosyltransferase [Paenibacillus thailandensis]|uniref:Nicotinate-nucleotide--dimethylbenzimidazole phosphoribosyltransferase n=1 Tax=Paenibacillus thailandensis TaxID=393250 RepID=A0ABW5R1L9_9BACL
MVSNQCIQLGQAIGRIRPFNEKMASLADRHSDRLTKPPGSLGKLERMARQLAGATGEMWPDLSRKAVIVMAADHGVCAEGVSAFPQEVTGQMVVNFLKGGAAVNVLARQAGADVYCVDVGMKDDVREEGLIRRNVKRGTDNIAAGPAMDREEAIAAVMAGVALVDELAQQGYRLFATGEMGIGNTTASAAVVSVLTGLPPETTVGRGTGIDDAGRVRKVEVVERAIAVNRPDPTDAFDVLAKVGGLEIAGLAGVIIGAAANGCPVVLDGYISSAAALIAKQVTEMTLPFMFASHLSQEQGHAKLLEALGLSPLLHLDMRLGEGTGAVLCFSLIDASLRLMQEMATFESAGVSRK